MLIVPGASVGFLFALSIATVLLLSCAPDLIERVREYGTTYNSHDVQKIISLYADDVKFEIVGAWVKQGKEALRELAEWDTATNLRMEISDISVSGDVAKFKLIEGNDWWTLAGIGEVCYEPCVMVFRDGLIGELRATMTQESLDAYARQWPLIIAWAKEYRSEMLNELLPSDIFVYGAEAAKKWLDLLREWRKSQK